MAVDPKSKRRQGDKPVKPPTIDLKAEEVSSDKGDQDAASSDAAKTKAAPAPEKSATGVGTRASGPANEESKAGKSRAGVTAKNEAAKEPPKTGDSGSSVRGMAIAGGAGAAAGAAMAFIIAALSGLGGDDGAAFEQAIAREVSPLQQQLAAAQDEISSLRASAEAAGESDPALESLQSALSAAQQGIEQLRARADALDERIASVTPDSDVNASEAVAGLQTTVERLSADLAALQSAANSSVGDGVPADLEARVAALEGLAPQDSGDLVTTLGTLRERLAAVESDVASAQAQLREVEETLGKVDAATSDDASRKVGTALALAALRDAVARGGSFTAELETLVSFQDEDTVSSDTALAFAELEGASASGVASSGDLAALFDASVMEILTGARRSEEAGIMARIIDRATSVVTVRQVGDVSGATPDAIVARIETALRRGDTQAAFTLWQALPEPARDTAPDFGSQLRERARVDGALATLTKAAISGLEGSH